MRIAKIVRIMNLTSEPFLPRHKVVDAKNSSDCEAALANFSQLQFAFDNLISDSLEGHVPIHRMWVTRPPALW